MKKVLPMVFLLALLGVVSVIAGCTSSASATAGVQTPYPVTTAPTATTSTMRAPPSPGAIHIADTTLGKIVVDPAGMTLYYSASDIPSSGTSRCHGTCAAIWPSFSLDPISVDPPLVPSDFSSFVRPDGTTQVTYNGWPLYRFQSDKSPGDMKGENVLKTWFVVKPDATVMIAQTDALGLYLADDKGRTLYYYAEDAPESTLCDKVCTAQWPVFQTDLVSAPSVLDPSDFSAVMRTDGVRQTAYRDHPLYYYAGDSQPGDTNGQGYANLWNVATLYGKFPAMSIPPTEIPTVIPTTPI